ncbi:MAG: hypothetical protein ACREDH_05080 [Methylocella sp.]
MLDPTFYRTAPGKVVRGRKPEKVVEEMLDLHRRLGGRELLFQDDDFPSRGHKGRRCAYEPMPRMHDSGFADNTIWTISRRAEYVEPELFAARLEADLFLVYMGIESGDESRLEILFKQMTVERNLDAIGAPELRLPAPDRRRRKRVGGVLAHAAVRRRADPRRNGQGVAAARRLDAPRLRLSRPAAKRIVLAA